MKNLKYYAEKSLTSKGSKSLECNLTLDVDGEKFHAYEVSVAPQDLLFSCDKGTLNYVVDSVKNNISGNWEVLGVELFSVERD